MILRLITNFAIYMYHAMKIRNYMYMVKLTRYLHTKPTNKKMVLMLSAFVYTALPSPHQNYSSRKKSLALNTMNSITFVAAIFTILDTTHKNFSALIKCM